ncbi:orotidine-5'-phosphate decarboxylase [Rhabdothermincola sediminis]|uniref:orotidine-5'-phosphate decarboxylase n=1 Tax=Rhabdothermincola sediminis TaxID=2751370 RepID=UPI001AA0345F|nr:orotidine-5'-phosphate decarboxylase [Rhabdothermincola sediminis]
MGADPNPEWMPDGADDQVRARLALALDVDDLVEAQRLGQLLRPWFGVAKIGLELYSAAGPEAIGSLADAGFEVFVDLKLLDIPTTVHKAARVLGSLGARYLTLHARGDVPMLRAGVEGLHEGAAAAGLPAPDALAVTVLTSDDSAPPHVVPHRIALAVESGCGGIVCAASDVRDAKELAPRLKAVVPGIRLAGTPAHDQVRSATPAGAIAAGADLLVIGRAVTQADDPPATAAAVAAEVLGASR